jgi:adenylate cyclase class 2
MEVELRAKISDKKQLKQKLSKMGLKLLSSKTIHDYYFGDLGLYKKINYSFFLRVRKQGSKIQIAYKGATGKDGIYEDIDQEVQSLETTLEIFTKMGLDLVISIEKNRESYKHKDINIEIDTFEGRGSFLELEIITEDTDKSKLFEFMRQLGISKSDIFEKGYITQFLLEKNSPYTKWIKN